MFFFFCFSALPTILVPRLADQDCELYNNSIEELNLNVPENTNFYETLVHQHGVPQSPQQQQPNSTYQGIHVIYFSLLFY